VPTDWTSEEVEATVVDYFAMLDAELRGAQYDKTMHRRQLLPLLNRRSEGSIEFKHQNISAVLIQLGFPYISGYKPRSNFQRLLFNVVSDRLGATPSLAALAEADAERVVGVPQVDDILKVLTDPPRTSAIKHRAQGPILRYLPRPVNYLELEARNRRLGLAGEQFVISYEQARLMSVGCERYAARIEHVARTHGDGDGFDVLSFDQTGEERFIEVKTTKYGRETPFFVSRNELEVSKSQSKQYHLYRLFGFRESPGLFTLRGALSSTCALDPRNYVATVA